MTDDGGRFRSFAEFWPFYLDEHRKHATRLVHVCGTSLAVLVILAAVLSGHLLWLIAAPVVGYGFAWVSHAFIERNRPATFTYPLWSLFGDLRMFGLWLTGGLATEIARWQRDER
jgi:hypothetical protein